MTAHIGDAGSFKNINAISVGVSGAWRPVTEGYVGIGGVWKRFWTSFSASVAPSFASAGGAGPNTFVTNSVTVTARGVGPFTYSWTRSGGDVRVTANSPKSATTSFRATIGVEFVTADFICTVTDTSTGDSLFVSVGIEIDGTLI